MPGFWLHLNQGWLYIESMMAIVVTARTIMKWEVSISTLAFFAQNAIIAHLTDLGGSSLGVMSILQRFFSLRIKLLFFSSYICISEYNRTEKKKGQNSDQSSVYICRNQTLGFSPGSLRHWYLQSSLAGK